MIKVLFVCLGNICRSPMAEAVFQHLVNEAGLSDQFEIDSAGTGGWHAGEQAHHGTRNILKVKNIPYDGRARQLMRDELEEYDYVLAMDKSNLTNILRFGEPENTEIALFLSYAIQNGTINVDEVPDPYFTNNFDYTYELVHKGSQALLDHIRQSESI